MIIDNPGSYLAILFFCVYFIFFIVIPLLVHIKDGEKADHEELLPKFENWGPRGAGGEGGVVCLKLDTLNLSFFLFKGCRDTNCDE